MHPPLPAFPSGSIPFTRHDGTPTQIWLGPATLAHAERQARTWRPLLQKQNAMDQAWDWRAEVETAQRDRGQLVLAAAERHRDGRLHGLMSLVHLPRASRLAPRANLLYVDMLAAAPWNRPGQPVREIKGIGPLLIQAATLVSREVGLGGAFGLHSLPDPHTVRFYRDTIGMTPVGIEKTPEGEMLYFEFTAPRADQYLAQEAV